MRSTLKCDIIYQCIVGVNLYEDENHLYFWERSF